MERTLAIIKPSAVQRGLIGEVITRFEKKGLKIVALKMYQFTKEKCAEHYSHLVDEDFYPGLEASMTAAPVILIALQGYEAIDVVRQMAGTTNGRRALPGTIRGDYSMSKQENIIHASDSLNTAKAELARFFTAEDYFDYTPSTMNFIYSRYEQA